MMKAEALAGFTCLGTPVHADETRSAAVCTAQNGEQRVVIAARGYVVIVDPNTGGCLQELFPEGIVDYPFAAMATESGLFVTGAGPLLMVLDPFLGKFVQWFRPAPEEEIIGMAFAEDGEAAVYATTHPGSKLIRVDVAAGQAEELIQLDAEEKYAMTLAAAPDGWIYAGIGTQAAGIVAYRAVDGTQRKISSPIRGSGTVHLGTDGNVYASLPKAGGESPRRWFRMQEGEAVPVAELAVAPSMYEGTGYQKLHRQLAGSRRIERYQLAEGELVIAEGGVEKTVPLHYLGNGTALSPMVLGPDGNVYGTSNHPLHLYRYEPGTDAAVDLGGKLVEKGGGGNICAYAAQGRLLFGAAYAGGHLHKLDTEKPLSVGPGDARNPRLIYSDERIHRPRSMLAHPDGEHVLYGGFPGYGMAGGALGVLHLRSESVKVYGHQEIVPYQSTLGLAALSSGDVIGGTSIETPGGAEPLAKEAVLYRFDWERRVVEQWWVPVAGAKEISLLVSDEQDRIHGLTSDSVYFVFKPESGELLYRQDLSHWGGVVRQGLLLVDRLDGPRVLGLLSGGLFQVQMDSLAVELVAIPPKQATSGIAYTDERIYFGSGSELWSYHWREGRG